MSLLAKRDHRLHLCTLFLSVLFFGALMLSASLSPAHANANQATSAPNSTSSNVAVAQAQQSLRDQAQADSEDALIEDLLVLSQLSKQTQTSNPSSNQTQSTQTSADVRSNRPAVASKDLILNNPVIDEAGILTASEKTHLEAQLRSIYENKLAQMALVTVSTTNGVDPFEYALAIANRWQLGNADTDDGILILVAVNDRKVRIVTGYGVEGVLPDATVNRIIREDITPSFRSGQYAQGLSAGIARIDEYLRADPDTIARANHAQTASSESEPLSSMSGLFMSLFVFSGFLNLFLRRTKLISTLVSGLFFLIALASGMGILYAIVGSFGLWIMTLFLLNFSSDSIRHLGMGSRDDDDHFGGFGGGSFGGGSFGGGSFGGGFGGGGFSGGGGSFGGGGAGGSW